MKSTLTCSTDCLGKLLSFFGAPYPIVVTYASDTNTIDINAADEADFLLKPC
jgi:hypothetical protein